jgi:hypothetical protein
MQNIDQILADLNAAMESAIISGDIAAYEDLERQLASTLGLKL